MVTSMKEEFTCVICQELFICAHTLSCSHSFCESCIKQWMKTNKDCPICRKRSTTQPIRSLVLDNAIATMESKLNPDEQKEREATKEERKVQKGGKAPSTSSSVAIVPSSSNPSTSGHPIHVVPGNSSANEVIVVHDDSETSSSESDSSSEEEEESSGSGGYGGYGGYGRCYHCGKHVHVCCRHNCDCATML